MKVYISGKITGLPIEEAKAKFDRVEAYLQSLGYNVVNPIKEVPYKEGKSWEQYMREDLKLLLDCDTICMLSNWTESRGAKEERHVALIVGMNVIFETIIMPSV